ncbi:RNA polymerase subunit sigma-70 [Candidatus Endobugula sertula]|uniref:RNA polymerase subunit sigma-70 n=1 Tax=Candidatus Endobugula sertula TaxID=62101 RepID=A0A1D2QMH1_9GAMM|nr:RNA polymerase subunit sigma-70 [Candidatus Endobugula sertula]
MVSSLTEEEQIALQHKMRQCMQKVAQHRDKEAFGVLFDHFAPLLRSFSLAREPGASLMADELTQVVLLKVWEKAHTYNSDKASVSTWIYTLARNSRIDLLRRSGRYTTEIDPEYLWQETEDESTDPFLDVQQKRAEKSIADAFEHLSIDQRQVLTKVYLEGKTHQESAEELALPLGTIKSRIRLALKKLQILVRNQPC